MPTKNGKTKVVPNSEHRPMTEADTVTAAMTTLRLVKEQTTLVALTRRRMGNAQLDATQAATALKQAESMRTIAGLAGSNAEQRAAFLREHTATEREALEVAQETYRIATVEHEEATDVLRNLRLELSVYLHIINLATFGDEALGILEYGEE